MFSNLCHFIRFLSITSYYNMILCVFVSAQWLCNFLMMKLYILTFYVNVLELNFIYSICFAQFYGVQKFMLYFYVLFPKTSHILVLDWSILDLYRDSDQENWKQKYIVNTCVHFIGLFKKKSFIIYVKKLWFYFIHYHWSLALINTVGCIMFIQSLCTLPYKSYKLK